MGHFSFCHEEAVWDGRSLSRRDIAGRIIEETCGTLICMKVPSLEEWHLMRLYWAHQLWANSDSIHLAMDWSTYGKASTKERQLFSSWLFTCSLFYGTHWCALHSYGSESILWQVGVKTRCSTSPSQVLFHDKGVLTFVIWNWFVPVMNSYFTVSVHSLLRQLHFFFLRELK